MEPKVEYDFDIHSKLELYLKVRMCHGKTKKNERCRVKCSTFTCKRHFNQMPLILEEQQLLSKIRELSISKEDCCICMEKAQEEVKVSCCGKYYCSSCLFKWYDKNSTCPTCRSINIL